MMSGVFDMSMTDDEINDNLPATYKDSNGAIHDYPYTGNRYVRFVDGKKCISTYIKPAEIFVGNEGTYTDPNLHRRILNDDSKVDHLPTSNMEYTYRGYSLHIEGTQSYRTTIKNCHSEGDETDDLEIP